MKVILYFHENNSVMILLSYRKGRHIHTSESLVIYFLKLGNHRIYILLI